MSEYHSVHTINVTYSFPSSDCGYVHSGNRAMAVGMGTSDVNTHTPYDRGLIVEKSVPLFLMAERSAAVVEWSAQRCERPSTQIPARTTSKNIKKK